MENLRHSLSHVLAQAVLKLYPEAKLAIGPAIDNGFYYDFDLGEKTFAPEDLKVIEKEMKQIVKQNQKFSQYELSVEEAKEKLKDNAYKLELIEGLVADGEKKISFYKNEDRQGNVTFEDMCSGPHAESTGKLKAFKLNKIAGAYWRGDEKNKMLQRIYGLAFETREELADYLKMMEEAEKRDHRKLGKELGLFSFHEEAPGFPFFKPKGMVIWNELMKYWREAHERAGYGEVKTPIMMSRKLWEISGHWENYRENMYESKIDETEFAIKPMNCPGGMLMFAEELHSYRELPLRWGEVGLVHRHELSGTLAGLFRVRSFHQDDAHIFMRPDQIKDEIIGVLNLVDEMYSTFGLSYNLELSTRPEKAIGSDEAWETSTGALKEALESTGKEFVINEGDGAFYGPKIDFHVKDAIGRTWQCGTIQLDMNLPERFDLKYTDSDGTEKRPVMIHRVIYGALERFFGILVEHYAGNFPVWLAPVQVKFIAVGEGHIDKCHEWAKEMKEKGIRVSVDDSSETVGYKIRKAEKEKVPYMLVVGDKEIENNNLTVRVKGKEEQEVKKMDELVVEVLDLIKTKK